MTHDPILPEVNATIQIVNRLAEDVNLSSLTVAVFTNTYCHLAQ